MIVHNFQLILTSRRRPLYAQSGVSLTGGNRKICRCNMLAASLQQTPETINLIVGAIGSVSRYSLALKQLIKYTCTILHTEITFNPYISLYFFPRTIFSITSRLARYTDKCMEISKRGWTLSGTATSLQFFLKILFLVPKVSNS